MMNFIPTSIIDAIAERNCETESDWSCAKESAKAFIYNSNKAELKNNKNVWYEYRATGRTNGKLVTT